MVSTVNGYARRDRVICWLCNQIFRLASPKYRAMIGGAIGYGMKSAARDMQEGRPSPPPFGCLRCDWPMTQDDSEAYGDICLHCRRSVA